MSDDAGVNLSASWRETLAGDRVGWDVVADVPHVSRETLSGDGIGRDIVADVRFSIRETLIKEPPIRVATVIRESVLSMPDDPLSVARVVAQSFQYTIQAKSLDLLWSNIDVASVVSMSVNMREMSISRSAALLYSLDTLATQHRDTRPAEQVISPIDLRQAVTLTTISREHAYEPQSEVVAKAARALAAQRREMRPAEEVISPIDLRRLTTIVIASIELPLPVGGQWAAKVVQLTVRAHEAGVPFSTMRVGRSAQLATQQREMPPPFTYAVVTSERQLAAQRRAVEWARSPLAAASTVQLSALARQVDSPVSDVLLAAERQLIAQHRDTPHPDQVTGVTAAASWQEATRARPLPLPGAMRSPLAAALVRVRYTLGRDMPPPEEVVDPDMGRHVAQLVRLSVAYRHTVPPADTGDDILNLFALAASPVLADRTFPEPPTDPTAGAHARLLSVGQVAVLRDDGFPPQSVVELPQMAEAVLLSDAEGWVDPTLPVSGAQLHQAGIAAVLLDDSLPPAGEPRSATQLLLAGAAPVVGDPAWPDPTVPNSDVRVTQVAQHTALADDSLPPADAPRSTAQVAQVAQRVTMLDPSIAGQFPASPAAVSHIAQRLVLADLALYGLPPRAARARPVITISIS